MRNAACRSWLNLASAADFVFLTGDLGFQALEPLKEAAGPRFINAGIAEQNMVSVAAGMARTGLRPWVYSIAPFCYARPFEQIRNDVCLHHLPVQLVGNGGGFGYGPMGATHHAIEDYGVLLALQNLQVWVPAFAEDVEPIVASMAKSDSPGYLRLGRSEKPNDFIVPTYQTWRKIVDGNGPVMVVVGPIAGTLIEPALHIAPAQRPEIWVLSRLPILWEPIPPEFFAAVETKKDLAVVEEHVSQGSVGQSLAYLFWIQGHRIRRYRHFHATGYISGTYGSQTFHRKENGLAPDQILHSLVNG